MGRAFAGWSSCGYVSVLYCNLPFAQSTVSLGHRWRLGARRLARKRSCTWRLWKPQKLAQFPVIKLSASSWESTFPQWFVCCVFLWFGADSERGDFFWPVFLWSQNYQGRSFADRLVHARQPLQLSTPSSFGRHRLTWVEMWNRRHEAFMGLRWLPCLDMARGHDSESSLRKEMGDRRYHWLRPRR